MLDNLKMISALSGLMKNQDKLKAAGERVKQRLEDVRVPGEAGGGAVRAVVSGKLEVISVEISPALANGMGADDKTRQLAGNLIRDAITNAQHQAQGKIKEVIEQEAKGLGLEGVPGLDQIAGFLR